MQNTRHPFWPSDWKNWSPIIDLNDYAKDWAFDANGDLCHHNDAGWYSQVGWAVHYQIISATLLPDDLIWLRTIECPSEDYGEIDQGGDITYRLMSLQVYQHYAAYRVIAKAFNGKKWIDSRRYRWAPQLAFDTSTPITTEQIKELFAAMQHAFEPGKDITP